MRMQSRQVILKARPTGIAQSKHFAISESRLGPLADQQIRVENHFLSVDPAMRGWIADKDNYSAPVQIGAVMPSLAAGRVVESRHPDYRPDDLVMGWFGWRELADVTADAVIRKVCETDLPLSLSLGVLGINGVTAYLALKKIGNPKRGETVLVSTAAGAVGSAVGQIATRLGCRTVGIAGGAAKVKLCKEEFGYTQAFDYKNDELDAAIRDSCPNGVDIYYDNTAGQISDIVMRQLALRARVIVCGTAAIASWDNWPDGPRVERHLLVKRAKMQGFVIFDHMDEFDSVAQELAEWVRAGHLRYREDFLDGIEACPDAIAGLYRGENLGKRLIRLRR